MKNYFRSVPYRMDGNPFIKLYLKEIESLGWKATNFKFWEVKSLIKYRKKCKILHIHWPEAMWRKSSRLAAFFHAVFFIFIFFVSRLFNYKWVWSAHNVIPHLSVRSLRLEIFMRKFILNNFDAVIGMSHNTKEDLIEEFGICGKKYIEAVHGHYENFYSVKLTEKQFRKGLGIPKKSKIFLLMNSINRENRKADDVIRIWNKMNSDSYLIAVGRFSDLRKNELKNKNIIFVDGPIEDHKLGSYFQYSDHLFLNYDFITTSGLFFLAMTFELNVIAPDLPFFKQHSTPETVTFFNSKKPLISQWNELHKKLKVRTNKKDFTILKQKYTFKKAAKKTVELYDALL